MRQQTRSWNIQRQTPASLLELSKQYNAILRGWWNYYGAFYKTVMRKVFSHFDLKLQRWARQKYKPLAGHKRRSVDWLNRMKKACPSLFVHWHVYGNEFCSGLMKPDTHLGENARQIEVSDGQTTPFLFC